MDYEAYEPEYDEYYEVACSAMFALMFNGGECNDADRENLYPDIRAVAAG